MQNPEQYAHLRDNLDTALNPAVEEILRWASPVYHFRRTATAPTELQGREIAEGTCGEGFEPRLIDLWYVQHRDVPSLGRVALGCGSGVGRWLASATERVSPSIGPYVPARALSGGAARKATML